MGVRARSALHIDRTMPLVSWHSEMEADKQAGNCRRLSLESAGQKANQQSGLSALRKGIT